MAFWKQIQRRTQITQWVLIGVGSVLAIAAAFLGVADNPPGIILVYLALICLAGAWVWHLPASRDYWIIFLLSLGAFPVGVVLHNLFYGLASLSTGIPILAALLEFFQVFFFLVAVIAAVPAALVALIGGIISSWRGMDRLTLRNRSIRRFNQNFAISEKKLLQLVKLTRQSASGANLQPLKFMLSATKERNDLIFPNLSWAGYLKDWPGPEEGERPTAYLIVLGDTELGNSFQYDAGIACQSITLGAAEMGLGACLIGSLKRETLRKVLDIPERYQILLVIALGKPAEKVVLENVEEGGDVKYWRDENGVQHVPKRSLEELILN